MKAGRWVIVAAVLTGGAAIVQDGPPRAMPDGSQWIDIHSDSDRLDRAISNLRNSTWDSTYIGHKTLEDAGLDCVTVQNNTWTFLAEVGVDFATQTDSVLKADGYVEAEYFGRANTILNVNNTGDMDHKALVHEAQHHAGWGVGVTDPTELLRIENLMRDAEDCQMVVKKEDEDDPGEGGTVTTCTDEPYTYKEWDWVWTEIEAGSCVGVSPVALPGEEPGEPELHCTPATWGYVLMEVEKEGVRTVCVTTSN